MNRVSKWFAQAHGNHVNSPILGDVLLNERSGIDETIQHGSGPDKLKAIASIPDVVTNGAVVYDGENPNNPKVRLVAVSKRVDISGKPFVVTAGFKEDANGRLFYDHELLEARRVDGLSSQPSEGFRLDIPHLHRYSPQRLLYTLC